jgi:cyclic beta-1,2-glucan synthetase
MFPPSLIAGVFLAISFAAGGVKAYRHLRHLKNRPADRRQAAPEGEEGAQAVSMPGEEPCVMTNGLYTLTMTADGRGWSRVFSSLRKGHEFDITRRSSDPLDPCGKFFFLVDTEMPEGDPDRAWALSHQPLCHPGQQFSFLLHDRSSADMQSTYNGISAAATVRIAPRDAVELWTVHLINTTGRNRTIELTSYRELVLNQPDAYLRHGDYNSLHIGTWFIRSLSALVAQNRLLKGRSADPAGKCMCSEVAFHAVCVGDGNAVVHLAGYEDSRSYFIGDGTLRNPQGLERTLRDPADEGLLYTFDPCASLRVRIHLPPGGTAGLVFADGYAGAMPGALKLMKKVFAIPGLAPGSVEAALARKRVLHGFAPSEEARGRGRISPRAHLITRSPFSFSPDGTELQVGWHTSRPWAHVLANRSGYGAVVTNQGDIFSFMGNAQQNALTPYARASLPVQVPGQALYLFNLAQGDIDGPAFAPFRKKEESATVAYGRGYVIFRKENRDCTMELTVSVLPDEPAEVRLLRIRNRTAALQTYRVVPYLQMVLGEIPSDTRGAVDADYDETLRALFFTNTRNDFHRGVAFVATSLPVEAFETVRSRFVGGPGHDLGNPCMVKYGRGDDTVPDDGFRIAGFAGTLTVPPYGESTVEMVVGCPPDRDQAGRIIRTYCNRRGGLSAHDKTRQWWSDMLSVLRVETNNAAFDGLVNDWLPYQVLVSHLWGRTGPNQRSGAYGFRDQLQSVLPMLYLNPALSREQILLHAAQQFYDGDVMQWWHQSWEGNTGLGVRNRAADPHLWLPYLVYRYLEATGDLAILNEEISFLEGKPIPRGSEGVIFAPRRSRDCASLYRHCMKALDFALQRFGPRGLPLIGTGDWNDGLNLLGTRGRGESVWLGFFLYDVLTHFSRLIDLKEGRATRDRYAERALRLKESLNALFSDGRYPRATTDDGRLVFFSDALNAAWPVISGVADFEQGACAMDRALEDLETDHLVRLLYPPFEEGQAINPGKLADYPPGVRENGGQYSHGASWLIDALVRLSEMAAKAGDRDREKNYRAKAVELWIKISPIAHTAPDVIERYGLPPHQQAADIYCGYGYQGRGGWSWYTGAAGRMLMGAYAILGLTLESGTLAIPDNLFEPRGMLRLRRLVYKGSECVGDAASRDDAVRGRNAFQPRRFKNL